MIFLTLSQFKYYFIVEKLRSPTTRIKVKNFPPPQVKCTFIFSDGSIHNINELKLKNI